MNKQLLRISIWIALIWLFLTTVALSATAQYTYDNLNRLIRVQYDNGTVIQYTYDALGNRLTQQVQAFSGAAAGAGEAASAPVSLTTPGPVSSTSQAVVLGDAAYGFAAVGPAWFALVTKIRLSRSDLELENLQAEIRDFLDQGVFSPEEKDRYQKMAAQEVATRADFIHRTPVASGKGAGKISPAAKSPKEDGAATPQHNKILKDKEKIYTSGPEGESEKPKP